MGRTPCRDKAAVKKVAWSREEDAKLKAYIEEHETGGNWIALPRKTGGKSCRLRWLNYLRPNIKHGAFTEEEDRIICSLYIRVGSRWSIIAAQLPGRTDNSVKNYWNTKLKKKLLGRPPEPPRPLPVFSTNQEMEEVHLHVMERSKSLQTLGPSAFERIQLHLQLQGPNHSSLWPNPCHLSDGILQGRRSYAMPTTSVQESSNGTVIEHSYSAAGPTEHRLHISTKGETSNKDPNLDAIEAELHEVLLHGEKSCFVAQEDHNGSRLGCIKEMAGTQRIIMGVN